MPWIWKEEKIKINQKYFACIKFCNCVEYDDWFLALVHKKPVKKPEIRNFSLTQRQ
jgi:hypothetical protein